MTRMRTFVLSLLLATQQALAADGLIAVKSPHPPKETMDRLESALKEKGMMIFARVDHAAGAAKVGKTLRPTELECSQSVGIDLPLKALVWTDNAGQVWLGCNDPAYIARRHDAAQCPAVAAITQALAQLAQRAVAK